MVIVMDARGIHERVREEVRREVKLLEEEGITPGLAVILLNDDPVELETQLRFVKLKEADARYCGIYFRRYDLYEIPMERRFKVAIELIRKLNTADEISGIIIQKPIPRFINEELLYNELDPRKDVDGLTPDNKKNLLTNSDPTRALLPCTAAGIVELLDHYRVDVSGMDVVIVGRSDLVGKPLSLMLQRRDATVTLLHSKSKGKEEKVSRADLVVSAVGRPPELYRDNAWRITGDMIKEGAVVIGVGGKLDPISRKWYFDVDEASVSRKASYITPNLNGVGLMTRARLLRNIIIASRNLARRVKAYG